MTVKTFYARTMHEAIRLIKDSLGPDAVILSSQRTRRWGQGNGLFGRSLLAVTAAIEPGPEPVLGTLPPSPGATPIEKQPMPDHPLSFKSSPFDRTLRVAWDAITGDIPKPAVDHNQSWSPGTQTPSSLHDSPSPAAIDASSPMTFHQLLTELTQSASSELAERCLHELRNWPGDRPSLHHPLTVARLRTVLANQVPVSGPLLSSDDERKVVCFIGPSGVGKTTTIAKLATYYRLEEKRSVLLVTLDAYRTGALEHLRMYANILGLALHTVESMDEALGCINRRRRAELVLLDTPGFNPVEHKPSVQWRSLFTLECPTEVHLTLSATTRDEDMDQAIACSVEFPILRLMFTKLDETASYGKVFNTAWRHGVPLSYWGTGPRVPEDLEMANPDRLCDFLLGSPLRQKPALHRSDGRLVAEAFGADHDLEQPRNQPRQR